MADTKALKKARTNSRKVFNAMCNTFSSFIPTAKSITSIEEGIQDLKGEFKMLSIAQNAYIESFDATDNDMEYLEEPMTKLTEVVQTAREKKADISSSSVSSRLVTPIKATVKCKQIEVQKFTNNVRDYPAWKRRFDVYFKEQYGEQAGLILKDALVGEAANLVRSIDEKNVEEIFKILDKRYGNSQKLVDTILADIEKLPACREGDTNQLKTLLQTIQLAHSDLSAVCLQSEIEHSSTVKLIERRLPYNLKEEWAKVKSGKSGVAPSKFYAMLVSFLDSALSQAEDVETMGGYQSDILPVRHVAESNHSYQPCQHSACPCVTSFVAKQQPSHNPDPPPVPGQEHGNPGHPESLWEDRYCTIHKAVLRHWPRHCKLLINRPVEDQVNWFLTDGKSCCRLCLTEGHGINGTKCPIKFRQCGKDGCKKLHSPAFHDALEQVRAKDNPGSSAETVYRTTGSSSMENSSNLGKSRINTSLSPAQTLDMVTSANTIPVGCLIDTGSVLTLVNNRIVRLANLKPASNDMYSITMETVGGDVTKYNAYAYEIQLKGKNCKACTIVALGVDNIGSPFPDIDMSAAKRELRVVDVCDFPAGRSLDLLIGMDNAHVNLHTINSEKGLVLGENVFGKVIYGTHPSFVMSNPRHYRATCYGFSESPISDLYSTDSMGVECSPRCGSCRCGKCAPGNSNLSLKEEREYQLIKDGLVLEGQVVYARYPWIKDPAELPDNYALAYKRLLQTERRLKSDQFAAQKYQEQIDDMLNRGVLRKLTPEEDAEWKSNPDNPVQYLPHHEVLKPSSQSTPVRIVHDPSSEYRGHAVNNYWTSGPNLILNALGLQIRFRENQVAVLSDIAKMYHTIALTPIDYHCQRMLWRNIDDSREPDIYVIVRNSFGSRPAGTVAIAALHLVADTGENQYPIGARTIREQTYVDDIMDSTDTKETGAQLINETDACLALGSFKTKGWSLVDNRDILPDTKPESTDETHRVGGSSEMVLGTHWNKSTDSFVFKAKINFSPKKKKIRSGPDLKIDEIFTLDVSLTLRNVLSQVNGYYDPMGLVGPYIVELKFALGKLWKSMNEKRLDKKKMWDEPIPPDQDQLWRQLFNAAFAIETIQFPRPLKPANAVGSPMLIMFSDSSMMAFGTCAYIRWQLNNGDFWARLIVSKSRIWPIDPDDHISVCRGELQGAVLAKRLAQTILRESRFQFERVFYLIDSEIVRAQIAKDSHLYEQFEGNRVGEIRSKTNPEDWYWIPGDHNASADALSRGTTDPVKLDVNSLWQNGPPFLYKAVTDWPISQTYSSDSPLPGMRDLSLKRRTMILQTSPAETRRDQYGDCSWNEATPTHAYSITVPAPTKMVRTMFDPEVEKKIADQIDVSRFSKLQTLLAVTYRILHLLAWKPGDGNFIKYMSSLKIIDAEERELALQFWLRQSQRPILEEIQSGKYFRLKPTLNDVTGIWHLNGRFGENPNGYHPILLPISPFVTLLVESIHRRGHNGAASTAAKVKDTYHVLKLRNLCRSISKSCTLCRKLAKRLTEAPMAPLPYERYRQAYAFEFVSCDIFGPFQLKVPGRITRGRAMDSYGQGYGLIFTCLSTRAIHVEAMEGYDTSAFLSAFRRFVSTRGQPKYVFSDNGSQIVAADAELKAIVDGWSDEELQKFGAVNGIRWQYTAPGSPWQNGVSEALIKSVKRSMAEICGSKPRLPIMNLQTIFYEISAILNERPINLGHSEVPGDWDSDCNSYLCPNQLLLGRSTVRIPAGPFGVAKSDHSEQFHQTQIIVNEWWNRWSSLYLPTLLRQSKWFKEGRKVAVGDICYVKDTNALRSDWQFAEVISAEPSSDGVIRHVTVRYKKLSDRTSSVYTGLPDRSEKRDVKNLVIILTAEERKAVK